MEAMKGRSTALLAYIPFVGFMIGYFVNQEEKHPFATWHVKNMFGLFLMFFVSMVIQSKVNPYLGDVIFFTAFFFWVYSFIMAYRYKEMGIPVLSDKFQEWFQFLNQTKDDKYES